jgi:hypothetical protein
MASPDQTIVEVRLSPADIALLDRARGELTRNDFLVALLRMTATGRVQATPTWLTQKDDE